ncbi:MAG: bacteriohemerythrin [Desulfovibrio sp.]|uniref:bacteriohemerythrin n=1 Tax=Desulfovibrio sp. TaxID=885 RepID=UPI0039E60914
MPAFFILLAIAPAIGAAGLLLYPPLSYVAGIAGLTCGFGGLFLLYRSLLRPLKNICDSLKQPGALHLPHDSDCGALCYLAELMASHGEARAKELAATRRDMEQARQDAAEWHEKYKIAMSGQSMTKDSLHEAARKLHKLSADLAEQEKKLMTAHPELSQTALWDGFSTQWLDKIAAELEYCENYLSQINAFLGGDDASLELAEPEKEEEYFQWSASYSTGVPVIDGQHKLLLSYVNRLHNGLHQGRDPALLLEILDALAGYAFTHFNTEEIFFAHTDYPMSKEHIEVHHKFKDKVVQFREALLEGRADVDLALLEFLKKWLIEHIQGMDVSFAPYVVKNHGIGQKKNENRN